MNPSMAFAPCLLCLVAVTGGCASDRAAQAEAVANEACRRADSVILETQTQMATLRSEMAAIRIEAAKKEAELQQLRRQVEAFQAERANLRQIHGEHQTAMEEQGETLQAVRRERDELAEAKRTLQAALARVSDGAPASEAKPAPVPADNKLAALEASIVALTTQIQHLHGQGDGGSPDTPVQSVFSVRVERGDTLGKLAEHYGVSVVAIQEANGLTGDLILAGQRLFIPRVPVLSP